MLAPAARRHSTRQRRVDIARVDAAEFGVVVRRPVALDQYCWVWVQGRGKLGIWGAWPSN